MPEAVLGLEKKKARFAAEKKARSAVKWDGESFAEEPCPARPTGENQAGTATGATGRRVILVPG